MKKNAIWGWLLVFLSLAATAEVPPFYPAPRPVPSLEQTLAKSALTVDVPGAGKLAYADFNGETSLDGTWKISPLQRSATPFADGVLLDQKYQEPTFADGNWRDIPVPLDVHRFDNSLYRANEPYVTGAYRKKFTVPAAKAGQIQQVLLDFGVIGYDGTVFVNGKPVGSHHGDFIPYLVNVTPQIESGDNTLFVRFLSDAGPAHGAVPAAKHVYGSQWSPTNIKAGLWQSVKLLTRAGDIYFGQMLVSPDLANSSVRVDYQIQNNGKAVNAELMFAVVSAMKNDAGKLASQWVGISAELKTGTNTGSAVIALNHPQKWSLEQPYLYYLTGVVKTGNRAVALDAARFGYRDFKIKGTDFYLNGERIYLFGENLRSVDFGGRNPDVAVDRASLEKQLAGFKSQGVNIIRTAHQPILPMALDIADEIGLMVYDESGWSFTNRIDPAFGAINETELLAWMARDYNHPSVVMWSGANEVVHRNRPDIRALLDRQVELIRAFDRSGRPAGSFSGSASHSSYGNDPLITDFLDLHSYDGLATVSWTNWSKKVDQMYQVSQKDYGQVGDMLQMPYIIWECVGYSWGGKSDRNFKENDINSYMKYVGSKTTWAEPNGIGFSGSIGLSAALDPARGNQYGKAFMGKRLLELIRQNQRIAGFAPWQHAYDLPMASIWNQPVLPGLRNAQALPPRNLIAENGLQSEWFVVNSTNQAFADAKIKVVLVDAEQKEYLLGEYATGPVNPWTTAAGAVKAKLPLLATSGQLRVTLSAGDRELGRNFYDLSVMTLSDITQKVAVKGKVALLGDNPAVAAILTDLVIAFEQVELKNLNVKDFPFAVVPPGFDVNRYGELSGYANAGGRLLILEQSAGSKEVLPGLQSVSSPLPFVDVILTKHPVFANLTQANFELWPANPEGMVIVNAISPFSANALAARGPLLSGQNIESAIMEAKWGNGAVFWSQLSACNLWKIDGGASTYLRNVLAYWLKGDLSSTIQNLSARRGRQTSIPRSREFFIDLKPYANRSFADWTGQGDNNFAAMPLGVQEVGKLRFSIIDPAANQNKSCLILRGSAKPEFPVKITDIKVDRKLARIFFLHTGAWSGNDAGRYRMHYDDGTFSDYLLVSNYNIGDWWQTGYLTDAVPGIIRANAVTDKVGTFVAEWENPYPQKTVTAIDFISAGGTGDIDYMPGRYPVSILIAATGELASMDTLPLSGKWSGGAKGDAAAPTITALDGYTKIIFPETSENGYNFALMRFDMAKFDPAKHKYLTFFARSSTGGSLDACLPEAEWKSRYRGVFDMDTRFVQWRKVRLSLDDDMQGAVMKDKKLRGEFFIYHGENKKIPGGAKAVEVDIRDLCFE